MQTTIFMVSIIGNVVLIILFIFKSALNDILKEWWMNKRKVVRENRERLIELRANLLKLSSLSPLLLIQSAVLNNEKDPIIKKQLKDQWDSFLREWKQVNEDILKKEILFSNDIRLLLKEFSEKWGKAITEVIISPIYKERLLKLTQEISSSVSKIIGEVDGYLL